MNIFEISIKRPILVMVVFIALALFGLLSYFSLGYDLLPKFSPGVIMISTTYPGASPKEVENTVTKKIEEAVAVMENVRKIESASYESLSIVSVTLTDNADADLSLNTAQRKINAILSSLPEDANTPSLNKISADDLPIMTLSATSDMDDLTFFDFIKNKIQPVLSRVNGVATVNVVGGLEREIQVNLISSQLQAYNLSFLQVQQAIMSSNLDFPTGSIKSDNQNILVRLAGKYNSVEELRNLVIVSLPSGAQIRLKDLADVQDKNKDVTKIARLNQKNAVILQVMKQSDANAVAVSEEIKNSISTLTKDYKSSNFKITVATDSTNYTLAAANAVMEDLIIAIVLVSLIMLFFLHSIRNSLIVMVAIPLSIISTFIGMYMLDFTLNLMSLIGLSLVVGILVDDAIVVIENISRHMEMGKNKVRAAFDGVKEIGFTVISITLVIMVVFLPISFGSSMVSKILREFSLVVVIAVGFSLLTSFTVVPLLLSRFGKLDRATDKTKIGRFILGFEKKLEQFTNWIKNILVWSLSHKAITMIVVIVLFFASFGLVKGKFIGSEFLPTGDRGEFLVQIELPKDASIEQTDRMTRKAEQYLATKKEIVSQVTTVGKLSAGGLTVLSPANQAEISVTLAGRELREDPTNVYAAKTKNELEKILVGAKVKTIPISIIGVASNASVQMIVIGSDLDSVSVYARKVLQILSKIPGTSEAKLSVESGNPEITVLVNRDKMAALGLNLQTVGATMQLAFSGNTKGKFRQKEYEYDINIRLNDYDRKNINDVSNIQFNNNKGQLIKLSQFAEIKEGTGPSQLERRDKNTSIKVQCQVLGRTSGDVVADLESQTVNIPKPLGVSYIWGGDAESQSRGFGSMLIALVISIVLVYFIMVALYNSFTYPLVVLFSIPLSIIGALLALALTNNSLNIFTLLGIIMLIGLVAKNAIILVDFTNQLKAQGKSTFEALIQANHTRLRPILMTTIAMIFGMLPIAIASGPGSETKNGLAWVLIGGLISSLFLTLIVVPVVYKIFDSLLHRFGWDKEGIPVDKLIVEPYEHKEHIEN